MERYNLTNEIAVDKNEEAELIDNGEVGDRRVTLYCAPDADDNGWLFYLGTNGDPVLLTETDTPYTSGPEAWLECLGLDVDVIAQAIAGSPADEMSTEWALETIGVDAREQTIESGPDMNEYAIDCPTYSGDEVVSVQRRVVQASSDDEARRLFDDGCYDVAQQWSIADYVDEIGTAEDINVLYCGPDRR